MKILSRRRIAADTELKMVPAESLPDKKQRYLGSKVNPRGCQQKLSRQDRKKELQQLREELSWVKDESRRQSEDGINQLTADIIALKV